MRVRNFVLIGLLAAFPAIAEPLVGHQAAYELSLEKARADVVAASGKMAYEVTDACDGWAVRQRLQMSVTNRDGQDVDMVSDYTTWEAKDGSKMRFRLKQMTDDAVTSEIAGEASFPGAGAAGSVHFTLPEASDKSLPAGTLFPMAHTAALLKAAQESKKFIALPLFDGTSAAGAQDSTVAIAQWSPAAPSKWKDLAPLSSGRVRIAFFDKDNTNQQPDYEVGMRYWANGVADDLSMDFGEFIMHATLAKFKITPGSC
jgi:hypothetical protein